MKLIETIQDTAGPILIVLGITISSVSAMLFALSTNEIKPKPMLCDETDEAVILKSEGWRARTAVDVPWIVDAAKKGWLEFEERPTLECYEPLHPDKRTVMNQFWWRAKVKKSGFPDVRQQELRPT